jgi:predicted transcriptional regulator
MEHTRSPPFCSILPAMEGSSLSPVTCRMARSAVDWTQKRLAHEAHVAVGVVLDFEAGTSIPQRNNLRAMVVAFELAGIVFLMHDGRILVQPPLSPVPKAVVVAD